MFTTEMAGQRLNMEVELIDDIFLKLNVDRQMLSTSLTSLNEVALIKYLDKYIVNISEEGLSSTIKNHKTLKEIILALTCKSGSIYNLEPIWIIFMIVMYKEPKCHYAH